MVKVVLNETVEHLGSAGEIVDVKSGYARNFLLPRGLAARATTDNLQRVEQRRQQDAAKVVRARDEAEALAQQIAGMPLELAHRAGDTDTIYGAVTAAEIAYALEEQGLTVDHRRIQLEKPIKQLGSYRIPVRLHPDVTAHVSVTVVRDEV